ncbi:MAG: hypothetical protein ACU837_17405 [Gammaproteobacteria bacterium]
MDRLHLMSVYVAVVEAEGFAGGARHPANAGRFAAAPHHPGARLKPGQ